MFTSRQRNSILSLSEFIKGKLTIVDNSLNVNINNEASTLEGIKLKVAKSIMFNNN